MKKNALLLITTLLVLICLCSCSMKNTIEKITSKDNTQTNTMDKQKNQEKNTLGEGSDTDSNNYSNDNNSQDEDTIDNHDKESNDSQDSNDSDSTSNDAEFSLDDITLSTHTGTISDPIPLGEYFKWEDESLSKSFGYTGTFTACVKSVKVLESSSEYEKYKLTESEDEVAYLVSLELFGENVTPTTIDDYFYYGDTIPEVSGTSTLLDEKLFGSKDYSFDTSIDKMLKNRYGLVKIFKGNHADINYSGDVIVVGKKGEEHLLIISRKNTEISILDRFIYFKLK